MNIVQSILTKNPCYTAGRKITVKGLMLHSVGCPQPRASVFIHSWNSASFDRACVHGFIDGNDGTVYQTLPWNHRGWHAGGAANNTHIGVEMCEPACIKYTGGSSFTCSDTATARAVAKRTYEAAVELFAMLCKEYGLNPLTDIISHREGHAQGVASNHGDPEHLWNGLKMGYTMEAFRQEVKAKMNGTSAPAPSVPETFGTQASAFKNLSEADVIAKVGPLFTADQKKSGILASVSLAQFILESSYGKSELAQNANNCFGMKKSLSGNSWSGSAWDGKGIYTKQTQEEENGQMITITADFRKYAKVEDSIADHSAYLLGAKNGSALRYNGLKDCTNYKKAVQIIKDGGYATSSSYVNNLCSIIERWNLTQYDIKTEAADSYYRVRKSWADAKTQLGAYKVLANAKACADKNPGYTVYDQNGKAVYPEVQKPAVPFLVRVDISDLNIRMGAGTNYSRTGKYTGKGIFTIMEVRGGQGSASGWGRLKSGAGWSSLDYAVRV
nr:MAG TPA: Muramidase (flagellum-specific) [Caudoviricetes sp.]